MVRADESRFFHPPVILVTGPTAAGKGRLALRLARHYRAPIISVDSMKVYRGMNIGSAKPPADLVRDIPIHLVDVRDPWEPFSIGDYLREVAAIASRLPRPWVFCGGTGFYVHALVAGIHPGPPPSATVREELAAHARTHGAASLHERLVREDPAAAARIHPADLRRVVRALEVLILAGEPISELQARKTPVLPASSVRLIGIRRPRAELYARIDRRVEAMFDAGWEDEVRRLLASHDPPWGAEASQSIGYEEIRQAIGRGEDPRGRMGVIQQRTRRFARSQLTWFRKMPIEWWDEEEEESLVERLDLALESYGECQRFPAPQAERLGWN